MIPVVSEKESYQSVATVFLDRDGVLNRKAPEGEYVSRWDLFHPLPGALDAVRRLNEAGLPVYVVTNQRGVALGLYTMEEVNALHTQLRAELERHGAHVDGIFVCPHDKGVCLCRKPGTGLFEQARAVDPAIKWTTSVIIGDSLSDIEAGLRLGMRTIFLDGEPERQKAGAEKARAQAGAVCGSLGEAVARLLALPAA